jgi:hypothetical protein
VACCADRFDNLTQLSALRRPAGATIRTGRSWNRSFGGRARVAAPAFLDAVHRWCCRPISGRRVGGDIEHGCSELGLADQT